MLAHRSAGQPLPRPLSEALAQVSCVPVLTLPQQTVAVADAAFVFPSPPCSNSAPLFEPQGEHAALPPPQVPPRGASSQEDVRFLLTVDRDDTIKLWDVALRRTAHEMSFTRLLDMYDADVQTRSTEATPPSDDSRPLHVDDEPALQRRRSRVKGLLAVTDVSASLLTSEQRRVAPGGTLPSMFAFLVQGRNQVAALVVLQAAAAQKGGGMEASIRMALHVPQFGFCKASVVAVPPKSWRSSMPCVLVALPGEAMQAPGSGGGGVALLYAVQQRPSTSDEGCNRPIVFDCALVHRLQVVDKSLRCGQLMSIQIFPWWFRGGSSGPVVPSNGELSILSLVTTESGHAVVAAHTVAGPNCDPIAVPTTVEGSRPRVGSCGCALIRCCAEPLMDARLGTLAATGTTPERTLLYCVSAEGNIQSFLVCDDLNAMWQSDGGVVVPQWPLQWEHKTQKGAGVVGLVHCDPREGSATFLAVGGWDGSILLLDGNNGSITTCLDFHSKSITGLYFMVQPCCSSSGGGIGQTGPAVCPAFARAVRMSRLGQPRCNNGGGQHQRRSSPVVFCSTADDGTIAVWRFDL